jgi:hypothetical protein
MRLSSVTKYVVHAGSNKTVSLDAGLTDSGITLSQLRDRQRAERVRDVRKAFQRWLDRALLQRGVEDAAPLSGGVNPPEHLGIT